VVGRAAVPVFGDGLVEAVDDQTLENLAQQEPAAVRGTVKMVTENFLQTAHVGRFGWKDDHAFLRGFSGDAYLNEMGITNPDNPLDTSTCATGIKDYGLTLEDTGIEDPTGTDGRADIDRFTDFMRALAPPPTMPQTSSSRAGAVLFAQMGCDGCHTPQLVTASNPASFVPPTTGGVQISAVLNHALSHQTFHPFSDFLLHDVGTGDGIGIAMEEHYGKHMYQIKWKNMSPEAYRSAANRIRTAPLWGVRTHPMLMHDGASLTFREAIIRHRGEAHEVTERFERLSQADQQAIIEFLKSL
jgi:CxxC motif-containing protein (DUF1111 family)